MTQFTPGQRVLGRLALFAAICAAVLGFAAAPASARPAERPQASASVDYQGCSQDESAPGGVVAIAFSANFTTDRVITVYKNGKVFFSDQGEIPANTVDDNTYHLATNARWAVVVRLGTEEAPGRVLARERFRVNC